MTPAGEPLGIEVGLAPELHDALGDLVRVPLLLAGVLEELRLHGLGVDALGHEVVALVAQHAHQLGGEGLVEQADDGVAVGLVGLGHGAVLDVLSGPLAQRLDVRQEVLGHLRPPRPTIPRGGFSGTR